MAAGDPARDPKSRGTTERGIAETGTNARGLAEQSDAQDLAESGPTARGREASWEPEYVEGVKHDHQPTGRWSDIQADPQTEGVVSYICGGCTAERTGEFWAPKWLFGVADTHLEHYLTGGGVDLAVDETFWRVLAEDDRVRQVVATEVKRKGAPPKGHFRIEQDHYKVREFHGAFGAIDRVDYERDDARGLVRLWFKDRYEWHPYYPGIYEVKDGDVHRKRSNCVHAAMVELKGSGAADFWMKGKAQIALDQLPDAGGKLPARWRMNELDSEEYL